MCAAIYQDRPPAPALALGQVPRYISGGSGAVTAGEGIKRGPRYGGLHYTLQDRDYSAGDASAAFWLRRRMAPRMRLPRFIRCMPMFK